MVNIQIRSKDRSSKSINSTDFIYSFLQKPFVVNNSEAEIKTHKQTVDATN